MLFRSRQLWALAMLKPFEGKERIELRGKQATDPAVTELRKIAGRPTQAAAH